MKPFRCVCWSAGHSLPVGAAFSFCCSSCLSVLSDVPPPRTGTIFHQLFLSPEIFIFCVSVTQVGDAVGKLETRRLLPLWEMLLRLNVYSVLGSCVWLLPHIYVGPALKNTTFACQN